MPHLDAISFFVFILLLCPLILVGLWNVSFPSKLRYGDGLRFVAVWMLFSVVVMVMNQVGRETLDPGRWPRERLFYGVEGSKVVGTESAPRNLLLGWVLFPLRVLPQARYYLPAIATGIVTILIVLVCLEAMGRSFLRDKWKSRWPPALLGAFTVLFFMSYATIGLVRQLAWIVTY